MDAPERRRALAGGRMPASVRWAGAAITLTVPLAVSYFVASLTGLGLRGAHGMLANVPLLVASVLIGGVGIGAARRILDRRPASPWLIAALAVPVLAVLRAG